MWIPNVTAVCIEMRASDIFESVSALLAAIYQRLHTRPVHWYSRQPLSQYDVLNDLILS